MRNRTTAEAKRIFTAQFLFGLNSLIWVVFSAVAWQRLGSGISTAVPPGRILVLMMLGNAVLMAAAAIALRRRKRTSLYFAIALIALNLVLTVTDELGTADLVTLAIDFVILGALVSGRSEFL